MSKPDKNRPRVNAIVDDLTQQNVLPDLETKQSHDVENLDEALISRSPWEGPIGDLGHQSPQLNVDDENEYAELLAVRGSEDADDELRELSQDLDIFSIEE